MAFCNKDDLTDLMSEEGIYLLTSDTDGEAYADDGKVDNAIARATAYMKQYLNRKYDTSLLSRSNAWVQWCAATIACVMLVRRRGNPVPVGLQESYDEFKEYLRAIWSGEGEIPDAVPRNEPGITMSNLVLDPRLTAKIRVRQTVSAGEQTSAKVRRPDLLEQTPNF